MSEPAPELDAEDALRGVVNQLIINGERMPVIIPGSVIETLTFVARLVERARGADYVADLMRQAMPWTAPLAAEELDQLASDIAVAADSGDHAPERLAAVLREWRESAEILGDPDALAEIAAARAEIDRGDFLRGAKAIDAMRPRR
ncbi:MAG TPA: hypothetical protein VMV07_15645 [Streptosporangiaceae bacterium]|nr:hypothetical protein [Streptosporangiaceae bacterium]